MNWNKVQGSVPATWMIETPTRQARVCFCRGGQIVAGVFNIQRKSLWEQEFEPGTDPGVALAAAERVLKLNEAAS